MSFFEPDEPPVYARFSPLLLGDYDETVEARLVVAQGYGPGFRVGQTLWAYGSDLAYFMTSQGPGQVPLLIEVEGPHTDPPPVPALRLVDETAQVRIGTDARVSDILPPVAPAVLPVEVARPLPVAPAPAAVVVPPVVVRPDDPEVPALMDPAVVEREARPAASRPRGRPRKTEG